ncbi:hypothetical protein CAPTEDRAFT_130010 [Capitella teleta]|uniref:Sorting nexin-27 n=1 Tax=Capitella teleta TaxID=283909 RepID=R7UIQ7_CAPTE|nr:hypothetical protein CAPTEDRAFT_130010 [Capitella teleta]|eukprot:ELU05983.1 hypothetical protein CAPTEDRAFT_130010 [Capitella teleta]
MADSEEESCSPPAGSPSEDFSGPRVVVITKTETGFGFNVRGQVNEGGQLKSINGELYAPMQHVSAVLEGGAAQRAGIRKGDRILEVNGSNVEGSTHKQVVDLIRSGGDSLTLTVVSVPRQVADQWEPSEESSGPSLVDYSEKRSLPISVPSYQTLDRFGEKYVVYNIHMAGRHLCSRRYREFSGLHVQLKREFSDFNFPKLPGKWPFQLSEQQLDARRRGIEQYLEKVCAVRVLADCDVMQEFLSTHESSTNGALHGGSTVELKVLLPDRNIITVSINRTANTHQVHEAVVQKLNMDPEIANYFALFEIEEYNFERKLQASELPHNLYIKNYSTATATCISLRKWLFCLAKEIALSSQDEQALNCFFWQAVEEVSRGQIKPADKLYELKALQDSGKKMEYLRQVRSMDGYGEVAFPHCLCNSRKGGHVIAIVATSNFKLQACKEDGTLESQVIEFEWADIEQYEVDEESFNFAYKRDGKKARWVKIFTNYFVYMYECFERLKTELNWEQEDG